MRGASPLRGAGADAAGDGQETSERNRRTARRQALGRGAILGFAPAELIADQVKVALRYAPRFALIAGGRPEQAKDLEQFGDHQLPACAVPAASDHVPGARRQAFRVRRPRMRRSRRAVVELGAVGHHGLDAAPRAAGSRRATPKFKCCLPAAFMTRVPPRSCRPWPRRSSSAA